MSMMLSKTILMELYVKAIAKTILMKLSQMYINHLVLTKPIKYLLLLKNKLKVVLVKTAVNPLVVILKLMNRIDQKLKKQSQFHLKFPSRLQPMPEQLIL
uniref:Uncharacterized protein n=1 Tax=Cacopsylla melanoneura TaxID=428564 RepID=A0A8D9FIM0_9HEMI